MDEAVDCAHTVVRIEFLNIYDGYRHYSGVCECGEEVWWTEPIRRLNYGANQRVHNDSARAAPLVC